MLHKPGSLRRQVAHARLLACPARGPAERWKMQLFSPEATSYWTAAASSLACSRLPLAPRARLATLTLPSRTAASPTPTERGVYARSWRGESGLVSWMRFKSAFVGSVGTQVDGTCGEGR